MFPDPDPIIYLLDLYIILYCQFFGGSRTLSVLQWSAQKRTGEDLQAPVKYRCCNKSLPSQSAWRKKEFKFVPNASLTLQSKSWKKQCRNGVDTCENDCAWQTKGCAKGTGTRGLLTSDPALSPLFPFSVFYTLRSTVRITDCESKLGKH